MSTDAEPSIGQMKQPSDARLIKIVRHKDLFILAGTEPWAQPGTADLLLHDIFHHEPGDDGSMTCELMSYGAQAWIEHHTDDIRFGVSYDELSAVIESTAEVKNSDEASAAFLVRPAPAHADVDRRFYDRFKEIATEAFQESSFAEPLAKISDQRMSEICDEPNLNNCASWMSYGFARARERFPDPEATHQLFNTLYRAVKQWAATDKQCLELSINETSSTVTSPDADFEFILERLSASPSRAQSARP